jgi:hypothetical protein
MDGSRPFRSTIGWIISLSGYCPQQHDVSIWFLLFNKTGFWTKRNLGQFRGLTIFVYDVKN